MSARKNIKKYCGTLVIPAIDVTRAIMPKYNGFACGHGAHGDTKYNRAKEKQNWRKECQKSGNNF